MAVLAPMPMASDTMATTVRPGLFSSERQAKRRSRARTSMGRIVARRHSVEMPQAKINTHHADKRGKTKDQNQILEETKIKSKTLLHRTTEKEQGQGGMPENEEAQCGGEGIRQIVVHGRIFSP